MYNYLSEQSADLHMLKHHRPNQSKCLIVANQFVVSFVNVGYLSPDSN
jgi:hypothetical protein